MSFIRVKTVNGGEYAYLVENKWYKRRHKSKNKGSRQKVSKYLGKVYSFEKKHDTGFFEFMNIIELPVYLKNISVDQVIQDMVKWELYLHEIDTNRFIINFDSKKVKDKNKEVSLKINEGFLNTYTLSRLFNLKSKDSYYLAKSFIEAGIEVPKEVFVELFSKT